MVENFKSLVTVCGHCYRNVFLTGKDVEKINIPKKNAFKYTCYHCDWQWLFTLENVERVEGLLK